MDQNLDENKATRPWLETRAVFIGVSILLVLLLILVTVVAFKGSDTDLPPLGSPVPTIVAGQLTLTTSALHTLVANGDTPATFIPDVCAGYYGLSFGGFQPNGTVLMVMAISPATTESHIRGFNLMWQPHTQNGQDVYLTDVGVSNANESPDGPSYLPIWRDPEHKNSGPTADTEVSTLWLKENVPVLKPNTIVNIWLSFANASGQLSSAGANMTDFINSTLTLSNGCVVTLSPVNVPTLNYWVMPVTKMPTTTPTDTPTSPSSG